MRINISFVLLVLLFGCGQTSNGTVDVSEKIKDYLGIAPYLPETDYDIGTVIIEYGVKLENGKPTKGEPSWADIFYISSSAEKADPELMDDWKEGHPRSEVIYGDLYMNGTAIWVTVVPHGVEESIGAEMIEIDGHEIQYQYLHSEPDFPRVSEAVAMSMDYDGIGYKIIYLSKRDNIEEEAKAFAKEIINHN